MREYKIVPAAPYCCVCAVIESIADRHGYNISQYELANYARIVCSQNDIDKLPAEITNFTISENPTDWGIHLSNNTINDFFAAYNIPLKETFIDASQFDEISFESILNATSENFDILFFLSHGVLYDNPKNLNIGHCVLYIRDLDNYISYLDPGPANLGLNNKDIYSMYLAVKRRALHGAGLSIISSY